MEIKNAQTVEELTQVLSGYGSNVLFRGQVSQYGTDGAPEMSTSFMRNGCVPPLMLRWSHYASFILSALLGKGHHEISLEFTQAVLQHYGWRSFFLDLSSSPAVSAWFAAHRFSAKRSFEICEDCFENPVWLIKLKARYLEEEGDGFLYVISKEKVRDRGIGMIDLASIQLAECRARFHAQSAWLLGPLHINLPLDCIVASVRAPKSVFRDFAALQGFTNTESVFPPPRDDPVLQFLTTLPWKQRQLPVDDKFGMKFFDPALELPEYHDSFRKRNPPHVGFYCGESAARILTVSDLTFFEVCDDTIFGNADVAELRFPLLTKLVRGEGQHVVFEVNNLVRRPGKLGTEYAKGIAISKCDSGALCLADFVVEHPGLQLTGCGINMGWHYMVDSEGVWERAPCSDDCPCGNESTHNHHLSSLAIVEDQLRRQGMLKRVESGKVLPAKSDPESD
ncbi:FRG domain-containing protein [Nitratireductor sp. ac15]